MKHSTSTESLQMSDHPAPAGVEDPATLDIRPDTELRQRGASEARADSPTFPSNAKTMEIYWSNVRYSVTVGSGKKKMEREILKGVGGRASPGEIVAVMGGSGAGKTTLLNVLAGRVPTGLPTGTILANGQIRNRREWKRIVGYVEQEDLMYENLTVRETLMVAAKLRLSWKLTNTEKERRVDAIMADLGISHIADSRIGNSSVGGISGGEKKRVSIGIELVTDPGTLFLDEPTTGLDSATANNICEMLQTLVKKTGKPSVVMTIHMPRETILDMIDKVVLMSKGKTIWFGPAKDALTHFASHGHPCPNNTNPADFFVDLIQADPRKPESQTRVDKLLEKWAQVEGEYLPPLDPTTQAAVNKDEVGHRELEDDKFATSWGTQFSVLIQRNMKHVFRDKTYLLATMMQQIILFLILGFVFFRITNDQAGIQNRYGVLFFICINQTFSNLMPIVTVFPLERRIILRERAAGSYRSSAAYLAKALSQWPSACLASLLFTVPVYWLIGLNPDGARYVIFLAIAQSLVLSAQSLGLLIGSSVPNVQMAQVFAPLVVVLFVVFGGNFANQNSITPVLRWIQWISLIRYAYGAFMGNEFNGLTLQCPPGAPTAPGGCSTIGDTIVDNFALGTPSVGVCIVLLLSLAVVFQVAASFVLRRTTRKRMIIF